MDFGIRRVTPEDAEKLSDIAYSAKAHWGYPQRWMKIWKPQFDFPPIYFEDRDGWVAEIDGEPIAFYTIEEKNSHAWIENMWVSPAYIGNGIGKQLFMDALSRSRQRGYLVLRLESDPNAQGFYENIGMRKIGESSYPMDDRVRFLPVMEIKL